MKKQGEWDVDKAGGEVVIPFAFSVAITLSHALCAREESLEAGGLLFKQSWEEGYCAMFSPTKAPNTDSQHKRACLTL